MQKFVAAMAKLHAKTFPNPWPEDDFHAHLQRDSDYVFVLGKPDDLVGFIIGRLIIDHMAGGHMEVLTILVDDKYKRQGYGETLLYLLEDAAMEAGAKAIILEVAINNNAAKKMYEKNGYKAFGMRKNYYFDQETNKRCVDAINYQKHLA